MNRIKIFLFTLLALIIIVIVYIAWLPYSWARKTPEDVLRFIKKNPDKASLYLLRNDKVMVDYHSDRVMPLASTVKIIVAIEYAKQVAEGKLKEERPIELAELNQFYLKNTDGNAHPKWLQFMESKALISDNNKISLKEVAKGMISHSSNANTEYLFSLLGVENINNTLKSLEMPRHTTIYPMTSACLIPMYIKDKENLQSKELMSRLESMSQEENVELAVNINQRLKEDRENKIISELHREEGYKHKLQLNWSNRLPSGTTKEYATLLNKINNRAMFTERVASILHTIIETDSNPIYAHLGFKGGSAKFVLTTAIYATEKDGEQSELAVFINDQIGADRIWIEKAWWKFINKVLEDSDFRKKAQCELKMKI